jgi:hypothetical protein
MKSAEPTAGTAGSPRPPVEEPPDTIRRSPVEEPGTPPEPPPGPRVPPVDEPTEGPEPPVKAPPPGPTDERSDAHAAEHRAHAPGRHLGGGR